MTEQAEPSQSIQLDDILEILERRKFWILAGLAVGMLLGGAVYLALPRSYTSSTTLLVEPQEIPKKFIETTVTVGIKQRLDTLQERVTSYSNLLTVIERVGAEALAPETEASTEDLMAIIRRNLGVALGARQRGNPAVFNITYTHPDPSVAAQVAREVADLFITENIKERARQAEATASFLDDELTRVQREVERREEEIRHFKQEGLGALPSQLSANLRELDRLNSSLEANDEAQLKLREKLTTLRSQLAAVASGSASATLNLQPRGKAAILEQTRSQLVLARRVYTDEHPNVIRLQAEIERLEREVAEEASRAAAGDATQADPATLPLRREIDQLELDLAARERERQRLRERLALVEDRVERTPKLEAELATLTRDYDNLRGSYARLLGKKREASLARNLEVAQKGERFKVLRPARPPRTPSFPDPLLLLGGGAGLGLLVVALLVAIAEFRNPSFRSIARLSRTLGLPVLASVPRIEPELLAAEETRGDGEPSDGVDPLLVVHTAPDSAPAEQYRAFAPVFLEDEKRRVVLVTSAARGDGKSVTCSNLAVTVARDLNRRVLLIDADLRRPTAHRLLRRGREHGLSDVLQGSESLEECAQSTSVPNLTLLAAGRSARNPLALLTDKAFLELIEQARRQYDAIFIDSPPLMPVVDTRFLKKLADMVIFVVRADSTPREAVVRSMQDLRDVSGVVFNEVSTGSFRRYYYYDAYSRYAYGEEPEERGDG